MKTAISDLKIYPDNVFCLFLGEISLPDSVRTDRSG